MVFCCVPLCGSDSWTSDPNITFHEFPSNPDFAAKWIQQINSAIIAKQKPMWFPRGKSMICSKHFLETDFKDESDNLKPNVIPTIFGHKYIGLNGNEKDKQASSSEAKKSPLIVNLLRPATKQELKVSELRSIPDQGDSFRASQTHSKMKVQSNPSTNSFLGYIKETLNLPGKNEFATNKSSEGTVSNRSPYIVSKRVPNANLNQTSSSNYFVEHRSNMVTNTSVNIPKIGLNSGNMIQKKKLEQNANTKPKLIEIGPNTFLKINPDVIKVNKKQTPSGNTVLQFVMDQKLARGKDAADLFPKLIRGSAATTSPKNTEKLQQNSSIDKQYTVNETPSLSENSDSVQHVIGHLIDTHVCKDSCAELNDTVEDTEMDATANDDPVPSTSTEMETTKVDDREGRPKAIPNFLNKAPVLFTTNTPLTHCLMDKPRFMTQLRQKSRQIASLKFKIASLTKKVEELEDRCIVQERQLSYSFLKRMKTIRKNASKGDSCATYILEQIRCYAGKNKMRWSDSTLSQCAVWCRKAPYAYEYFKKSDFFKLPCLGTVKRFMKKHPELKFMNKINIHRPNYDESSSDFDFDDSDSDKGQGNTDDEESGEPASACETILTESDGAMNSLQPEKAAQNSKRQVKTDSEVGSTSDAREHATENGGNLSEATTIPMAVDGSNLEVQELILPSGEVVQCYSSNICNGDGESQYYIIPSMDQNTSGENEYNVVQASAESLRAILQNLENAQLPQEQLIFITNSSDQLECTETEVVTASV